jgi:hypothetical protein
MLTGYDTLMLELEANCFGHQRERGDMPITTADELVSVLIPRRLLGDVYGFVAEHEHDSAAETTRSGLENGELDEALVKRMYDESQPRHQEYMKLLAEHPDQWLYTSEVAKAMALPHGSTSVAGMLGAFGRRANHRYGGAKPWTSQWDGNAAEARHKMSLHNALIIKLL